MASVAAADAVPIVLTAVLMGSLLCFTAGCCLEPPATTPQGADMRVEFVGALKALDITVGDRPNTATSMPRLVAMATAPPSAGPRWAALAVREPTSVLVQGPLTPDGAPEQVGPTCEMAASLAFSADGTQMAVGCDSTQHGERAVELRHLSDGTRRRLRLTLKHGDSGSPLRLKAPAFSADLSRAAVVAGLEAVELFDMADGTRTAILPLAGPSHPTETPKVDAVAFAPSAQMLAVAYHEGTVELFDLTTQTAVAVLKPPKPDRGLALAFSPDGTHLATASFWGNFHLWRLADGQLIHTDAAPNDDYGHHDLAWSPDGSQLYQVRAGQLVVRGADGVCNATLTAAPSGATVGGPPAAIVRGLSGVRPLGTDGLVLLEALGKGVRIVRLMRE
ncbi:MAG: hypothetical protein AAFS10_03180 [Myxococcota bacterium]